MTTSRADAPIETVRARRAVVLAVASRTLVALIVLVGIGVVVAARQQPEPIPVMATTASPDPVEDRGLRIASLGAAIEDAVARTGAELRELRIVPARSDLARVTLRVVDPGAVSPDRIVGSLRRAGLADPEPTTIVPTVTGIRLDVTATARLSTAPLPQPEREGARPLASLLSDLVVRSGATLVRIALPDDSAGPVRMEVSGSASDIVDVLAALEAAHTAPARFEQVLIRSAADARTATIVFHERRPVAAIEPAR